LIILQKGDMMHIGSKIRELRKQKNMTLEDLSRKSGVALATLSRIENNKMSGTLSSHQNICKALNVSITSLYRELEDAEKVVEPLSVTQRTEHHIHSDNAVFELLVTKTTDKNILPLLLKLEPGASTEPQKNEPGIEKFVYVIEGRLQASVAEKTLELGTSNSLYFDASLQHSFSNKTDKRTKAVVIVAPPSE
jgi:transcriptional regulator with XRE-family HTH domain